MDVKTASALSVYNFNSTANTYGRSAAVQDALANTYASLQSAAGADPMAGLLTTAALAPLASALYGVAGADGEAQEQLPVDALQAYIPYGGVNAATAALMFEGGRTEGTATDGLMGFGPALTASSSMALAAYEANQAYLKGTTPAQTQSPTLPILNFMV